MLDNPSRFFIWQDLKWGIPCSRKTFHASIYHYISILLFLWEMEHFSIMCKIKEAIVNGVSRWVHKEKKNNAKFEKLTNLRVSVFKRINEKIITKEQDKAFGISHVTRMKEERKVINKKRKGSNKFGHYLSSLKRSSSKCCKTSASG